MRSDPRTFVRMIKDLLYRNLVFSNDCQLPRAVLTSSYYGHPVYFPLLRTGAEVPAKVKY